MANAPSITWRFSSWRDLILTPLIQIGTLVASAGVLVVLNRVGTLGLVGCLLLFYPALVFFTLGALYGLRCCGGLKDGVYRGRGHAPKRWAFNCFGYLCATNLWPLYGTSLLPPLPSPAFPFSRKLFYRLMGAKVGKGLSPIVGHLFDPSLVEIGDDVMVGARAVILCHAVTNTPEDTLVLRKVTIGSRAIIGAGSMLMPGVRVGESSVVSAMSFVAMNTEIPPFEVWGGNPARKLLELPVSCHAERSKAA